MDGARQLGEPSNRKQSEDYAKRLLKWIDEGENLFSHPPAQFNWLTLFAPGQRGQRDAAEAIKQKNWGRVWALSKKADSRWDALRAEWAELRISCEWVIDNRVGQHGGAGYQQERAAIASRVLMRRCGLPIIVDREANSTYCRAASVFYEEMTGQQEKDLRRACEAVARRYTEKR
jgi:hypothetical protein